MDSALIPDGRFSSEGKREFDPSSILDARDEADVVFDRPSFCRVQKGREASPPGFAERRLGRVGLGYAGRVDDCATGFGIGPPRAKDGRDISVHCKPDLPIRFKIEGGSTGQKLATSRAGRAAVLS